MTPSLGEGLFLLATLSFLPALWRASRAWPGLDRGARLFAAFLAADILLALVYVALQVSDLALVARRFTAVVMPLEKMFLLFALAAWQVDVAVRRVVAALGILALLFWIPALSSGREPGSLGLGLASVQALLIFTVTAFLIVRRTLEERRSPAGQPWFWLAGGLLVFYGTYALIPPLTRYFEVVERPELVEQVAILRSAVQVIAGLLFYRGFRCAPLPGRTRSGIPSGSSLDSALGPAVDARLADG